MGLTNTAREAQGFTAFAAAVDASAFVKRTDQERIRVGRSDDGLWWYRIVSRAEVDEQVPALPTDTPAAQTGMVASGDRTVNFILQGRGGLGRSLIASLMAPQFTTGADADGHAARVGEPANSSDAE